MAKTLGIIGGMGMATVKFFEKIVLRTKATSDEEHIHILIDNNTQMPGRPKYIFDNTNVNPKYEMIRSANNLKSIGADFLAMPCNTAHYFYNDIVKEIDIPFLNMIEVTLEHIKENYPKIKKVGLLGHSGLILGRIYDTVFENSNVELLKPTEQNQKHIDHLIASIKIGKTDEDLQGVYETLDALKQEGAELFIAGCTEISVAIDVYNMKGLFIDPMDVLADRVILFAGKELRDVH